MTNEELYGLFSHNLCTTNVYMEMEMHQVLTSGALHSQIFRKDVSKLPLSCKDIHIQLKHISKNTVPSIVNLACCQEFKIFDDLVNLHLNGEDTCSKPSIFEENELSWWEAEVAVRGFQEKITKGLSIWKS